MLFSRYLILALCCLSLSACGQDNPTLSTARTQQNAAEPNPLHTAAEGTETPAESEHHDDHAHDDHSDHEHHDHDDHADHDHADHDHAH